MLGSVQTCLHSSLDSLKAIPAGLPTGFRGLETTPRDGSKVLRDLGLTPHAALNSTSQSWPARQYFVDAVVCRVLQLSPQLRSKRLRVRGLSPRLVFLPEFHTWMCCKPVCRCPGYDIWLEVALHRFDLAQPRLARLCRDLNQEAPAQPLAQPLLRA